jgi:isoquinoline 1-oxidoreductase beta subunit
MLYATVVRPPTQGTLPIEVDEAGLQNIQDLVDVVTLPDAVALVAQNYPAALSAERAVKVRWGDAGDAKNFDSDSSVEDHVRVAQDLKTTGQVIQSTGDLGESLQGAGAVMKLHFIRRWFTTRTWSP